MLKNLFLENWKSHSQSSVSFQSGTNIFVGKIGAGKSSLVDAICFALYGTYPALKTDKLTIAETIMFKPVKKDSAKIILTLEFDKNIYKVEREIFLEKTNTAKLYKNDKLIAGPKQTDVNEKITALLEIDYNLFIKIVYSEQNEIDYFLKIPPGKRKEQFDSLFGINNLENIKINSRELSRLLTSDLELHNRLLSQIQQQLSTFNINQTNEQLAQLKIQQEEIEKTKHNLLTQKQTQDIEYKKISEKKEIYEKHKTQIEILKFRLEKINLKAPKEDPCVSLETLEEKQKEISKNLTLLQEENKKTEFSKTTLENKILFYTNEITNLEKEISNLQSKITKINPSEIEKEKQEHLQKNKETNEQFLQKQIEETNLKKAITELEKGFFNCPVCDSLLSKEQQEQKLKEKKTLLLIVKENLQTLSQLLLQLDTQNKNLQKKEQEVKINETNIQKIKDLVEKQKTYETINQETHKKIEALPKIISLESLQDEQKQVLLQIEQQQQFLEKKEIEENLNSLESIVLALNFSEKEYIIFLTTYNNLENELKHTNSLKLNLETQQNTFLKIIEQFSQLQKEESKNLLKINHLKTQILNVSYFTASIEISQNQLRKVLVDNINKTLELIWPKIYTYGDYISARLNTTNLKGKNDYVLEVLTKDNGWIRVEGLLSGGERTCAALSIRVAIALSLTKNLKLLILDEPTHNLDEKTVITFSEILNKELPELVNQVFVVTHDKKLLEIENVTKFKINRDKENDGVSKIVEV